jgi:hypothetical protein
MPAQADIHAFYNLLKRLDYRLRGNDVSRHLQTFCEAVMSFYKRRKTGLNPARKDRRDF